MKQLALQALNSALQGTGGLANGHYAVIALRRGRAGRNLGGGFVFFNVSYRTERLAEVTDFAVIMLLREAHFVAHLEVADEVVDGLVVLARGGVFDVNHNNAAGGIGIISVFRGALIFHVFEDAEACYLRSVIAVIRAVCRAMTAGNFDGAEVVGLYRVGGEKLCVFRQGGGKECRCDCGQEEQDVFADIHVCLVCLFEKIYPSICDNAVSLQNREKNVIFFNNRQFCIG